MSVHEAPEELERISEKLMVQNCTCLAGVNETDFTSICTALALAVGVPVRDQKARGKAS